MTYDNKSYRVVAPATQSLHMRDSQWVSYWQALPMIGLGSDKNIIRLRFFWAAPDLDWCFNLRKRGSPVSDGLALVDAQTTVLLQLFPWYHTCALPRRRKNINSMDPDLIYTPSSILVFQTWILGCTSISIPQDLLILTHLTHRRLIDS